MTLPPPDHILDASGRLWRITYATHWPKSGKIQLTCEPAPTVQDTPEP